MRVGEKRRHEIVLQVVKMTLKEERELAWWWLCWARWLTPVILALWEAEVKCPYKKVNLKWFTGTVNPCPGLYQPICGTNFVTYDNPCILCIESLKSEGKIKFYKDGNCTM
nr:serine protease inhibitor Kazal-type 14 [Microcebus murinus]